MSYRIYFWRRLNHSARLGKITALLALPIALAILTLPSGTADAIPDITGKLLDRDSIHRAASSLITPPSNLVPITFIDIDEKTYASWQFQHPIPKTEISRLLNNVSNQGALGVLLDIDLSGNEHQSSGVEMLRTSIATWKQDGPALLIAKSIEYDWNPGSADGQSTAHFRESAFDDAVASNSNVYWVSAAAELDSGVVLRNSRLWEVDCGSDTAPTAIPSTQLFVAFQRLNEGALDGFLASRHATECGALHTGSSDQAIDSDYENMALPNITPIPYLFGWPRKQGVSKIFFERNGRRIPLLLSVRAETIAMNKGGFDPSLLSDRFVIIGASYYASRDIHRTPSLDMPGALAIANAVAGSSSILELPGSLSRSLASAVLLLMFVAAAVYLVPLPATMLIALISLVSLWGFGSFWNVGIALDALATALSWFALWVFVEAIVRFANRARNQGRSIWHACLQS